MNYEKISKLAEQIFSLCDMAEDIKGASVDKLLIEKVEKMFKLVKGGN